MTAVNTLERGLRAYGFDSERGDNWRRRAACRGMAAFFTGYLPADVDQQARACHVCGHCTVQAECRDLALGYRTGGVVQAGKVWNDGREYELPDPGCGDHCAHLRGGPRVHAR